MPPCENTRSRQNCWKPWPLKEELLKNYNKCIARLIEDYECDCFLSSAPTCDNVNCKLVNRDDLKWDVFVMISTRRAKDKK
jgi:hypothetical protein